MEPEESAEQPQQQEAGQPDQPGQPAGPSANGGNAAPEAPTPPPAGEAAPPAAPGFSLRTLFRRKTPQFYVAEGKRLAANQNLAQATIAFQQALELDPDNVEAFKALGNALLRKGGQSNVQAALEQFEQAAQRDPMDIDLYAKLATALEKLGKKKEATLERKKAAALKALQSDGNNPVANNNMGIFMLRLKRHGEAVDFFKRALGAKPDYDMAVRNLAATYLAMAGEEGAEDREQNLELARTNGYRAVELSETVPSLLVLTRVLLAEERFEEALNVAEQAERVDETSKDVFATKKVILEKLNRMADAQEAYDRYRELLNMESGGGG